MFYKTQRENLVKGKLRSVIVFSYWHLIQYLFNPFLPLFHNYFQLDTPFPFLEQDGGPISIGLL